MLFNASQKKGILLLLGMMICLIVIPRQFLRNEVDWFILTEEVPVETDSLSPFTKPTSTYPSQKPKVKVELNSADSGLLTTVKGIGPYYASKIIRYRQRLGGYVEVRQLKELKLKYFDVDSLGYQFTVNPKLIVKREMDTMSFKAILRHPYLEYEDVKLIFNAKRKYQTISYSLLEEKKILPAYKLKKIKPYFK